MDEAAAILGVSRRAVYDAARRGELPSLKVGRRVVISRKRLDRLLHGHDSGRHLAF